MQVEGCDISNVANAIVIAGGDGHTITSNNLRQLGAGGVVISGLTPSASHRIVNNHIFDFARDIPVWSAGVNVGHDAVGGTLAQGVVVANNDIHTTPHMGVLFSSINSVFESNEIHDFCKVSNDSGAFYRYQTRLMELWCV